MSYLTGGILLPKQGLPAPDWAPLYSVWYWVLSLLKPDPVELFYFNIKALCLVLVTLVFVFLRANKVRPLIACGAACLVVAMQANLDVWPKVSHFAICILLLGLTVASFRPKYLLQISVLTAFSMSYARPEFFLVFLVLAAAALVSCFRATSKSRLRHGLSLLAIGGVVAALTLSIGCPFFQRSDRSFVAFKQHFALNWVKWTKSDLNAWNEQDLIAEAAFGKVASPMQCAAKKPALVARHVVANLTDAPRRAFKLLLSPAVDCYGLLQRYARTSGLYLLGLLLFAGLAFGRPGRSSLIATWRQDAMLLGTLGIFILPPLAASALIFPRDHYLLLILIPLGCGLLVLSRGWAVDLGRRGAVCTLGVGAYMLAASPESIQETQTPMRSTLQFIHSLKFAQPVRFLDTKRFCEPNLLAAVPMDWSNVPAYSKDGSFGSFLRDRRINAILLDNAIREIPRYSTDPEWRSFISNPAGSHFTSLSIPETTWRLLVADDLLEIN
jgi:hypothetical protein